MLPQLLNAGNSHAKRCRSAFEAKQVQIKTRHHTHAGSLQTYKKKLLLGILTSSVIEVFRQPLKLLRTSPRRSHALRLVRTGYRVFIEDIKIDLKAYIYVRSIINARLQIILIISDIFIILYVCLFHI